MKITDVEAIVLESPQDRRRDIALVKAAREAVGPDVDLQEATAWGFHDLICRGKIDVVQPDLSRCGGLSQARKILWEAERAGVDVAPHAWLTDLLSAASLHVNACLPRSLFLEYNVSDNPMLREIIRNPIGMDADGTCAVPQGPGLGVEVDEHAVAKFRVPG